MRTWGSHECRILFVVTTTYRNRVRTVLYRPIMSFSITTYGTYLFKIVRLNIFNMLVYIYYFHVEYKIAPQNVFVL